MACSSSSLPLIVLLLTVSLMSLHTVESSEFNVGGDKGWATPPSKNQLFYNDWASKNRFKVNDTLRFLFDKDSVMMVRDEREYDKCQSTLPIYYFNNGTSTFITLDHPGLFYFISGVATHCQKGLKMIVKVLEPEIPPPAAYAKESAAAVFASPEFVVTFVAASLVGFISI